MADLYAQTVADARAEPGAAELRWEQAIAMGKLAEPGIAVRRRPPPPHPRGWSLSGFI